MTTVADDSDSDDHKLPEKEPEFIVHIVDDHRPPPAPPLQMYRPHVPYLHPPLAQQLGGGGGGPKDCTCSLFTRCLLWSLVFGMVVGTLCEAIKVPKEYRTGGDQVFIIMGPIIIAVLTFVWIIIDMTVELL
ncbi:hypothetical protein U9M48_011829 [Paspalum notatum var. saurae]|uniref:Uncharacterized protein n=1 Tax=Paspalum notatum var. saurae TaxID=547442 RepID=A0AAQ3SWA5_PASNO